MPDPIPESMTWFRLYPARFEGSRRISMMTMAQRGIMSALMNEFWIKGALPDDSAELSIICLGHEPYSDIERVLKLCWELTPEGWVNRVLNQQRESAIAVYLAKSEGGKKSAQKRAAQRKSTTPPKKETIPPTKAIPEVSSNTLPTPLEESSNTVNQIEESSKSLPTDKIRLDKIEERTTLEGGTTKPKRHAPEPDVILIRHGLKWGQNQHPEKRGYQRIKRVDFEDVMFATNDPRLFPLDLVIETQEELTTWLES